jgi:DNA recombination protein RmuC
VADLGLLFLGLVAGALVTWLLARAHFAGTAARDRAALEARLAGLETLEKELARQLTERQLEVGDLRAALDRERMERARAEERATAERTQLEEQRRLLDGAREELANRFKALSAEALSQTSSAFLERARESLEAQLGRREQAVEGLLRPLQEALRRAEDHAREIEKARQQAYGSLDEQLRALAEQNRRLQREAGNLASALRSSQTRGRWGEIALRRIVELAGMTEHCDFSEQVSVEGEGGRLRPDMVVHLPGRRDIVIDVKAPLDAYDEALRATTDEDRQRALAQHAQAVRNHMVALANRGYARHVARGPDLVVMFIPGESFVAAAVEADAKLLVDAMERRVVIATPTTLFTLLSAIAHGWRQEAVAKNAEEIRRLGQDLYERLATLAAHVRAIGQGLERAVDAYNDAVGSIERRVLPAARKFRDLGIGTRDEPLPALEPVDPTLRRISTAELGEQLALPPDDANRDPTPRESRPGPEAEEERP